MASNIQVVLRKKPNSKGLYPIAIRITKDRSSTYKYIGIYVPFKDWDDKKKLVKKSNEDSKNLNQLIAFKMKKVKKELVSLILQNKDTNVFKIKKEVYARSKSDSFFELAKEHLEELEVSNKWGRRSTDSGWISFIRKYNKSSQLSFKDIDERFLMKFKSYLTREHSLSETSILNILVLIRLLYNRAIKDKIVKRKFYPFGKDKVQIKFPEIQKIGLNKWEIQMLEQLTDLSDGELHARNVWMYSFNLAGIRVSDVLKTRWSDFKDERLYYRMGKNSKLVSLKVPLKIYSILEHYKNDKRYPNDFIFPELKNADFQNSKDVHNKLKTGNNKINRHLKKIAKKIGLDKPLTMHIARHSFGHIAGDMIHPIKLQKLYRHTDLRTTINYQTNFVHTEVDEALDSVLNF